MWILAVENNEEGEGNVGCIVLRRIYAEQGFRDTTSQLRADELQDQEWQDRSQWTE